MLADDILSLSRNIKILLNVFCVSSAVTANTAAKVPKPGFGYDWNTGGPSYKS